MTSILDINIRKIKYNTGWICPHEVHIEYGIYYVNICCRFCFELCEYNHDNRASRQVLMKCQNVIQGGPFQVRPPEYLFELRWRKKYFSLNMNIKRSITGKNISFSKIVFSFSEFSRLLICFSYNYVFFFFLGCMLKNTFRYIQNLEMTLMSKNLSLI